MSKITTHILDISRGNPVAGVEIILYRQTADTWQEIARGRTNPDGRISEGWTADTGTYKLRFETKTYQGAAAFYPFIEVPFEVTANPHYHIPLLLSPYGYSTYRGS
jgi:5-hydroxyisourate hydrolase